tara:strand:- start:905 stop:1759 length:855 start_codon:yes stop_codon:yes gene_type:complete
LFDNKILEKLKLFVEEDIGYSDLTTDTLINNDLKIQAEITSQNPGIIAGLNLWKQFFINCNCDFKALVQDGDIVNNNQIIAEIQGSANKILKYERTFLNLVSRMSGIATETNKYSTIVKNLNLHTIVACTRKTAPGLNYFDKEAVRIGGGDTHRYRLDDAVLIKDNHIFITNSIKQAVQEIKLNVSFTKKIEVETKSYSEVIEAVNSDVDIIMLDNMNPNEIKKILNTLKKKKVRNNFLIEASGGINKTNFLEYIKTGVDIISIGDITHSNHSLNISLNVTKIL